MRLVFAIVFVVVFVAGFALVAEAQEDRGWNFSGTFNGSRNSDGTVMKAAPALGYTFNNFFQTYAGVPFYFVNRSSTTTPTTPTTNSFINGIGNAFLGARLSISGEPITYSSTLELTAPTGD